MNDEELTVALAATARISDDHLDALPLGSAEEELMNKIMSEAPYVPGAPTAPGPASPGKPTDRSRSERRWRTFVAVGAAAAAVVIGVALFTERSTSPAYAAEVVQVAEANDRLLIDLPGWRVSRVDEFTVDVGEMTFTDGSHEVDLHWRSSGQYAEFIADRSAGNPSAPIVVLGRPATMFQYAGSTDFTTIVEQRGVNFLEIRADLGSEQAYRSMLDGLKSASVNEWLGALPESAVKPADRLATVQQMLTGVPIPDGLDVSALASSATVSDRYQLGAQVTAAVACEWFDRWFTATETGDTAAAQAASEALVSSHGWPILHEMAAEGAWPEVLWEYADATAGGTVIAGTGTVPFTRELPQGGLGCL